jgi:chorismate dehydratase
MNTRVIRIASVSYLNATPLHWGLHESPDVRLELDVPSRLIDHLGDGRADVALLPVIDYQRLQDLCIVPAGAIGCDGPTLTVRIFSPTPIEQIESLACDPESHTSVALARIILAEQFGIRPEFVDLAKASGGRRQARLLIGDKVICDEPPGFEHQLDLGAAWKELTSLPFIFAVWTARQGVDLGDLPARLEKAKRDGLAHAKELIERHAIPRGWPAGVALQYLTVYLKFDVGPRQLEAIERFFQLASAHNLIPRNPKPITLYAGI